MATTTNIQRIEQDVIDIINYLFVLEANGSIRIALDPIDHWQLFKEFGLSPTRKDRLVYSYFKNLTIYSEKNDTWEEFFRTGDMEIEADAAQIDKRDQEIEDDTDEI
jgi:hypothetical protein